MSTPQTHADIIALWPTKAEFARATGISPANARQIAKSKSIPSRHYQAVVDAVEKAGFPRITYADLVEMAKA